MNKISGIYGIRSISHPERVYIGSAINIKKRWKDHERDLRLRKHHSKKLQRHYNKYGISDLVFEVIVICYVANLIAQEQAFINLFHPYFNINPTAGSNLGIRRSKKTRERMSKAQIGRYPSENTRQKHRDRQLGVKNANYGRPRSPECRQKIRESLMGHQVSSETREKQSQAQKNRYARDKRSK